MGLPILQCNNTFYTELTMSAQTLPLSTQDIDKTVTSVEPAADATSKPKSFLQKAFEIWIKPYENAHNFIPM